MIIWCLFIYRGPPSSPSHLNVIVFSLLCWQCPTTIIPFFGDQPFWGDRVHEKGVGPAPIPVNHLTLERLVNAIEKMLDPVVHFWNPLLKLIRIWRFATNNILTYLLLFVYSYIYRNLLPSSSYIHMLLRVDLYSFCETQPRCQDSNENTF